MSRSIATAFVIPRYASRRSTVHHRRVAIVSDARADADTSQQDRFITHEAAVTSTDEVFGKRNAGCRARFLTADVTASAASSTSTNMPPDLHGRDFGTRTIATVPDATS
jgi:hypothetical protein